MKSEKQKRSRRRHTDEFKAGAVRLVEEEGRPITQVSADLGVDRSLLSRWVQQARTDKGKGAPGALTSSERDELAKLRKENRVLKMERDILKKAAAFFANDRA